MHRHRRPDVLVVAAALPARTLLCAQLIEDGYDVVPVDGWPPPRIYFRDALKPRVVIVDLQGLPEPATIVAQMPALAPPDRVIVLTALGAIDPARLRARGFEVMARPATIGDIAVAVRRLAARQLT